MWTEPASEAEEKAKDLAVQAAVLHAIEVPLRVMEVAHQSMEVAREMAKSGLPASLSDAGVAALCARSAVMGAHLNVRINAGDLKDEAKRQELLQRAAELSEKTGRSETEILKLVDANLEC